MVNWHCQTWDENAKQLQILFKCRVFDLYYQIETEKEKIIKFHRDNVNHEIWLKVVEDFMSYDT